jgi:DNA-binding IclR family transcriptional regulator
MRVKVKAPKAAVMRMRELALLPVLPLVMDPVHLLVEMQVLQGAEIKRIRRRRRRGKGTMKRRRRMSSLPLHQRTLGRKIQGRNPKGEGSLPSR